MKKTMTVLKRLIALYVFFLPGMICQAQIWSYPGNGWEVYNSNTQPPDGWNSVCPFTGTGWVTPNGMGTAPGQLSVIQAEVGVPAIPIWGSPGIFPNAYLRHTFDFDPREGCNTDSLVIMADDEDSVWINGIYLGHTGAWATVGRYLIPASSLRCGCNVIGIKAYDTQGASWWMACHLFSNPGTFYVGCSPAIIVSGHCQDLCFSMDATCLAPCQSFAGFNLFGGPPAVDLGHGCYHFTGTGTVTVEMYVCDACTGRTETIDQDFTVEDCGPCNANAGFSYSGTNPIAFTDASTGSGTITSYFWDFGDGSTSNIQDPIHSYAASGTYTVCHTIIVQDADGKTCCDQFCKEIRVENHQDSCLVRTGFTWTSTPLYPFLLNFTNTSVGYQILCDIQWNFGDPGSGASNITNTLNPSHFFSHAGVFHVCLYMKYCVYDANGNVIMKCDQTLCHDVTAGWPLRQGRPVENTEGIMKQNVPNPFTGKTEISYQLPKDISTALFVVTDEKGTILLQKKISENNGVILIDATQFAAGTYNYEMIIDGAAIETKRMVVGK